jgi:acyl CoA:acetate/3-ketoacid CoA transferase alpha subunit/acyl CoA:acetate/3-ketoacid CoA transferase beta subunit
MTLHFAITHHRPSALVWELVRQFWGRRPGFTVVSTGVTGPFHALVQGGLAARLVTAFCGDTFPAPSPHPIYQRAFIEKGDVEVECWSLLTIAQRLRAAAEGFPFAVTRSLLGSSMEDNPGVEVLDGVLRMAALKPDISFLHAAAADPSGNVVLSPPFGESTWGALAAREGAVVTVERIVDADTIRRHSHLVRLPAAYVRSVSEAPFGAHPAGLSGHGVDLFPGYAEDYDFMDEFAALSRDEPAFVRWIEENLAGRSHADYLALIGAGRLHELVGRADPGAWELDVMTAPPELGPPPTREERMACATADVVRYRVAAAGHNHVLGGIGVAHLGGWLAQLQLAAAGKDVALLAELGFVDFTPRPGESFIFNHANIPTCMMTTDLITTLGSLLGPGVSALGLLGGAQVDADWNVNSTVIPGRRYLLGSGGANDVASNAAEVVLVVPQDPGRLVDRAPYVTAPGRSVRAVVTDRAVFERSAPGAPIRLTGLIDGSGGVEAALAGLPWQVDVAPELRTYSAGPDDIATLRALDPHRRFLGAL